MVVKKGYDPRGRLIREWHTINGGTLVLVSSITYDEIERMNSNALGNSIVSMVYTYDIQNRLRKINDPANLGTKPFALELQYNSPDVTGATAQFAGNISAARWIQQGASEQTYYYNYDSYSRMTAGLHNGNNNEQYIGYDSNGNINALTRTGAQAAGLSYTYSGNRLTSLTKDGTGYSYTYDSNGNTTTDGLRGMTIAYNYHNLPKTVTKGSDVLTYIYDAAGSKLAEKINTTVNNFYTGAIVYKGDKTIDYIPASTGLIRKVGNDFVRQYNINDHLGNVRAAVNQSGTIDQANDYYPYGLAFSYNNLDKNRYLYNGKELQNQSLATTFFGVYDYGARYYDPVIGRWNSVDPMTEKYPGLSPYVYCANNPLKYLDPTGMEFTDDAWKWINKLIAEVNSRQASNNAKITEKQASLDAGGLSARQEKRLYRQIGNLQSQNSSLEGVRGEVATLAASDQMYDAKTSNVYSSSGPIPGTGTDVGAATFNFTNGNFEIVMPTSGGLSTFAHELKHAYQFETGAYSVGPKIPGEPTYWNLLYDKHDELEGYNRGALFGGTTYSIGSLPSEYSNIATGPVDATTHPNISGILGMPIDVQRRALQNIAKTTGQAFRVNGVTYYKPR